jgi:hypothetical protein
MTTGSGQLAINAVIDSAVDLFEEEYKAGKQPNIADYLGIVGPEIRVQLLEELIYIEAEYRCKTDLVPKLGEYVSRFPELSADAARYGRLADGLERILARRNAMTIEAAGDKAGGIAGEGVVEGMGPASDRLVRTTGEHAEGGAGRHLGNGRSASVSMPPRIGRYTILQILSVRSGQAEVFRVAHPNLGGDYILKRFRPKKGVDSVAMIQEGRKLAALRDVPGIARVLDADVLDGMAYIVLEYIPGRTLQQHAKELSPGFRRSAEITASIARGLGAAHRIGLSHLDVKPENILIDSAGNPKLIDFGIARSRDAWQIESAAEGMVSGTPAYMPPEQALGRNQELGPRSDVFSLGAVLYFLLTGRPLYDAGSLQERLAKAAQWQWDEPALQACTAPKALKNICRKAIAQDPADRYADGDAFAKALESFLRSIPIKRWILVSSCAIFGLLALALAGEWFFPNDPLVDLPLVVQVQRGERLMPIGDFARAGESLGIRADSIPEGRYAYLVVLNGTKPQIIKEITPKEMSRDLEGEVVIPQTVDEPTTEVVLVASSRQAFDMIDAPWPNLPALPEGDSQRVTPMGVKPIEEPRGNDAIDQDQAVRAQLEQLRQWMAGRVDGFEAIAFRVNPSTNP